MKRRVLIYWAIYEITAVLLCLQYAASYLDPVVTTKIETTETDSPVLSSAKAPFFAK